MKRGILLGVTLYFFFGNFLNSKFYHHYIVIEKEFEHYADALLKGYGNAELGSPIEFNDIPKTIRQDLSLPWKSWEDFGSHEEASNYHHNRCNNILRFKRFRLWKRTCKEVSPDISFNFFAPGLPQYGDVYIEKKDKNDIYSIRTRYTVRGYGIKLNFDKKILEENNVQKFDPNIKDWHTPEYGIIVQDNFWGDYNGWWFIPLERFKREHRLLEKGEKFKRNYFTKIVRIGDIQCTESVDTF